MPAVLEIASRRFRVGLLAEGDHASKLRSRRDRLSRLDISVARVGPGRRNAEHHDRAALERGLRRGREVVAKARRGLDPVIRGQDRRHAVAAHAAEPPRGERDGRGGVLPHRLPDDPLPRDGRHGGADRGAKFAGRDDPCILRARETAQALERIGDHRPIRQEREELLRAGTARERPEALSPSPCEDNWVEAHGLLRVPHDARRGNGNLGRFGQ